MELLLSAHDATGRKSSFLCVTSDEWFCYQCDCFELSDVLYYPLLSLQAARALALCMKHKSIEICKLCSIRVNFRRLDECWFSSARVVPQNSQTMSSRTGSVANWKRQDERYAVRHAESYCWNYKTCLVWQSSLKNVKKQPCTFETTKRITLYFASIAGLNKF